MWFFAPCTLFLWGSSVGWTIVFCLLDCCVHTFSAGFRDQLAILGDDPRINKQFLYASQHTVNPSFYLTLPISLSFFSIILSASPSVRLLQHLSFLLSFLSVLLNKNVNPARKHVFHDWLSAQSPETTSAHHIDCLSMLRTRTFYHPINKHLISLRNRS